MLPRFGEPVLQGIQYTQRPGAYAIIYASDCVLLTFQEEPFPEFQLPGGGIDMGESPLAAPSSGGVGGNRLEDPRTA